MDVRCMVGIAVWGRMYGNREFGGEPGSLLLYIILALSISLSFSVTSIPDSERGYVSMLDVLLQVNLSLSLSLSLCLRST